MLQPSRLYIATFLTFCALYAVQPLQPLMASIYQLTLEQAGLLTAIVFLPLSLAPLFYGYLLIGTGAKKLLLLHIYLLAFLQIAFISVDNFTWLVVIRLLQGFCFPAIFTAIMTLLGGSDQALRSRYLAQYVAVTIAGGALGRITSASFSAYFPYQGYFILLALALIISALLIHQLKDQDVASPVQIDLKKLPYIFLKPLERSLFIIIFCLFLSFSAFYNYLPFYLQSHNPQYGQLTIAFSYTGYFIGLYTSLNAHRWYQTWGKSAVFCSAIGLMASALLLSLTGSMIIIFIASISICAGMFLIHGLAGGLLNQLSDEPKGIINGAYVCVYYLGGLFGAYGFGFIYSYYNWTYLMGALLCVLLFAAIQIKNIPH